MESYFFVQGEKLKLLPVYILEVGFTANQEPIARPNGFPEHQLFLVLEGSGILQCANQTVALEQNTAFVLPANTPHSYYATKEPFHTAWVTFNGSGSEGLLQYYNLQPFAVQKKPSEILEDQYKMLLQAAKKDAPETEIMLLFNGYLNSFLRHVCVADNAEPLHAAKRYIAQNYGQPLSLADLADMCGMSRYTFCRKFKEMFLETPFNYILNTRICAAKVLLTEQKNLSVGEIARQIGFGDSGYFCRIFKRNTGLSPGAYREKFI